MGEVGKRPRRSIQLIRLELKIAWANDSRDALRGFAWAIRVVPHQNRPKKGPVALYQIDSALKTTGIQSCCIRSNHSKRGCVSF